MSEPQKFFGDDREEIDDAASAAQAAVDAIGAADSFENDGTAAPRDPVEMALEMDGYAATGFWIVSRIAHDPFTDEDIAVLDLVEAGSPPVGYVNGQLFSVRLNPNVGIGFWDDSRPWSESRPAAKWEQQFLAFIDAWLARFQEIIDWCEDHPDFDIDNSAVASQIVSGKAAFENFAVAWRDGVRKWKPKGGRK